MASPNLHKFVRFAEIGTVVVLSVFAFFTWRELESLRKFPVSLPSYQFEVTGDSDPNRVVTTRGTWFTEGGRPEQLVTTTIECRKARMECVESAARVVFVSGQGLMESQQTGFEVEKWNDAQVVTKPAQADCATRHLILDLKEKRALSKVAASEERGKCREQSARTLELVTGYKVKSM